MKQKFTLFLKGIAMGAADVVPGVSGGTIALITGVYEELIESIKSINSKSIKTLFKKGFLPFWKQINGQFLLFLLAGIFVSVLSLAKIMETLLEKYPIVVWSFFFGLIIASSILVLKDIKKWNIGKIFSLLLGIIIAYFITILGPAETPDEWWFIMLSGAIAICAMILPGISGAFILLLLGKYTFVISAISQLHINVLITFGIGAVVGILSFSNLLSYLLKKFHDLTITLLAGFMLGSLNKVWPWKKIVTNIDIYGKELMELEKNISPRSYEIINNTPSYLIYALLFCLLGFTLVAVFEFAKSKHKKST